MGVEAEYTCIVVFLVILENTVWENAYNEETLPRLPGASGGPPGPFTFLPAHCTPHTSKKIMNI